MNNKYLLIGDMHVTLDNLDESRRLIDFIYDTCVNENLTAVFMGDQYNNMGIVNVEVLKFWYESFNKLSKKINVVAIVGNHDQTSDGKSSSMIAHKNQILVVDRPMALSDKIYAIPFIRDNDAFIDCAVDVHKNGAKIILCHAEFNGAEYENGFYAPHGIDLYKCPPVSFVSGHIHKRQTIFRNKDQAVVYYIGTPRQLNRSDIGEIKGLTKMYFNDEKIELEFIPTPENVCERFKYFKITPDSKITEIPKSNKTYVDIEGTDDFIKNILKNIPDGVKVRTFPQKEREISEVKESDGIPNAFYTFYEKYFLERPLLVDVKGEVLNKIYNKCEFLKIN